MWTAVLLGCLVGVTLLAISARSPWLAQDGWWPVGITRPGIQHWLLLTIVVTAATVLAAAPLIRFLDSGWRDRRAEFEGRLRDGAILAYLSQFWQQRLDQIPVATTNAIMAKRLLDDIYVAQYGRRGFIAPVLCLLAVTFVAATLVVETGIDTCIERRCVLGNVATTAGRFAPLGDLSLPKAVVAALGGAYLFVVSDAITRERRRTLNVSDVYWYALRMMLAIPIGLGFSEAASPALASLISIGLGAFPMDSLLRILRRLTSKSIGTDEDQQNPDQLVQLAGVTVPISASLAAEGVDSIDELVGIDPVRLSIRTGIPFPSILRFASQAVVRLHLADGAKNLEPLGLANAYMVAKFIVDLDAQRRQGINPAPTEQRLLDAVKQLKSDKEPTIPSKESVEACFRQIAAHGYTMFLLAMD